MPKCQKKAFSSSVLIQSMNQGWGHRAGILQVPVGLHWLRFTGFRCGPKTDKKKENEANFCRSRALVPRTGGVHTEKTQPVLGCLGPQKGQKHEKRDFTGLRGREMPANQI